MFENMSDPELIIQTNNGFTEAYGELIKRYFSIVLNLCKKIVDHHSAEDMTQETFIDAYMKLVELHDMTKFKSWICQIAKNKCYRHYSRSLKFNNELSENYQTDIDSMPDEIYLRNEQIEIMYQQVNSLPSKLSETILLYYYENKSIHKIAIALNVPEGTVKRRLHDGREKLRSVLAENDDIIKKANMLSRLYIDEMIQNGNDAANIKRYVNEIIPELKTYGNKGSIGQIQFWLANAYIGVCDYDRAYKTNEQAIINLDVNSGYYANAIAARKIFNYLRENNSPTPNHITALGEGFRFIDGQLKYYNKPGYNRGNLNNHKYHMMTYYMTKCNNTMFDNNLKLGESIESEDTVYSFTADDETILTFDKCRRYTLKASDYIATMWFCENVGLVKVEFIDRYNITESYELTSYEVKSGVISYFPLAIGNKWEYKCGPAIDNQTTLLGRELVYMNDKLDVINFAAYYCTKITDMDNIDSDGYIKIARSYHGKVEIDLVIDTLKTAIRKNGNINATTYAVYALDYHKRFKKYIDNEIRYMPSSISAYSVIKKNDKIIYDDNAMYSMGPYRFGTRHEENKIFGTKIERYLTTLGKALFDKKWVDGYKESVYDVDLECTINTNVTIGDTIITAAGKFTDCLKVEFDAEINGEHDDDYYWNNFRYVHCGKKTYWFAHDVGVVRFDCSWGGTLNSVCELTEFESMANTGEYMPIYVGNKWVYDEMTIEEDYRARHITTIANGFDETFMMITEQNFAYLGTEEEYNEFKNSIQEV